MARLGGSTSPHLQQHRDNPGGWWEWEPAAFAEAARRGVPVLLSIGCAACHRCHVVAHESFEDDATAAYMNEHAAVVTAGPLAQDRPAGAAYVCRGAVCELPTTDAARLREQLQVVLDGREHSALLSVLARCKHVSTRNGDGR